MIKATAQTTVFINSMIW